MFYLPGVLKGVDGWWAKRAILRAARRIEAESNIDLIDAHFGYPEGVGCSIAAAELGLPVFITMRGLERQALEHPWKAPQLIRALQCCHGVICVSRSLQALALAHGIDRGKIRIIANAVERDIFHPGSRGESRRRLGLHFDGPLVVSVGMLEFRKGQHLLLESFDRLRAKYPDLRLALVGGPTHDRAYPGRIDRMIAELGVGGATLRPGAQPPEDVADWLRAADLFVLPTYDEGCCNAILEAMACGVPVVTTDVGDNAAQVDAPRRGLITPTGDADALAETIAEGLDRSWDRGEIARFGSEYTWDDVARRTSEFFRERLGSPEARRL